MIKGEDWGKNGRHHPLFKDIDFVQSLVGTNCRFCDVGEFHEWIGLVKSLFWDDINNEHCFDIEKVKGLETEESGYLAIWEIIYFERKI